MKPTAIDILRLSVMLSSNVPEHRFVSATGGLPSAGGHALGATDTAGKTGESVAVTVLGTAIAVAGAAISKGAALMVAADGRVITRTGTHVIVARALSDASAAGEQLEVLLITN